MDVFFFRPLLAAFPRGLGKVRDPSLELLKPSKTVSEGSYQTPSPSLPGFANLWSFLAIFSLTRLVFFFLRFVGVFLSKSKVGLGV